MIGTTSTSPARTKTAKTKVGQKSNRTIKQIATEPTTWAGLLTVAASILSGGVAALADPIVLTQVAAGLSLILAREG